MGIIPIYSFTSISCLLVLLTIGFRVSSKKIQNSISNAFILLDIISILYCINDIAFGFSVSNLENVNILGIHITTDLYYLLGNATAFLWAGFMNIYINPTFKNHKKISVIISIPFISIFVILAVNLFSQSNQYTNELDFFKRDPFKLYIYLVNLMYFLIVIIWGLLAFCKTKNPVEKKKYRYVFLFSFMPILALILQLFIMGGPFYSIGITISCLIIFCYINTSQYEKLLVEKHEIENLKKITDNQQVITSIANTYLSMHNFYLEENRYEVYKTTDYINSFEKNTLNAQNEINLAISEFTASEFKEQMLDFVNISTVSQRLTGKNDISIEFLGAHGWCSGSWIRIQNNEKGECIQAVFAVRLIDEDKRRELEYENKLKIALRNENEIFGEILLNQTTGTIVFDEDNSVLTINTAARKFLNIPKEMAENCTLNTITSHFHSDNKDKIIMALKKVKKEGGFYSCDFESVHNDDAVSFYRADAKQFSLSNGKTVLIISITDITVNKMLEKELVTLSETDSLTGINNRGSGENKTEALLKSGKTGMLCLMDADKFKSINDTFGHHVGDKVIIELSNALKKSFRDRDIIMRLGGDEFAMFAVGCVDKENGRNCMERLFEQIEAINIPELEGKKISVSVGCVLCINPDNNSFEDYYKKADSAMYFSKNTPGNSYTFHKM